MRGKGNAHTHSLELKLCCGLPSSAACRCLSRPKWSCTHAWCKDGGHACVHTVCAYVHWCAYIRCAYGAHPVGCAYGVHKQCIEYTTVCMRWVVRSFNVHAVHIKGVRHNPNPYPNPARRAPRPGIVRVGNGGALRLALATLAPLSQDDLTWRG